MSNVKIFENHVSDWTLITSDSKFPEPDIKSCLTLRYVINDSIHTLVCPGVYVGQNKWIPSSIAIEEHIPPNTNYDVIAWSPWFTIGMSTEERDYLRENKRHKNV